MPKELNTGESDKDSDKHSFDPDKIIRISDLTKKIELSGLSRAGFKFSAVDIMSKINNAALDGLDIAEENNTDLFKYSDEFKAAAQGRGAKPRGHVFVRAGWLIEQLEERGLKDPETMLGKLFNGEPMKLVKEALDMCADYRSALEKGDLVSYVRPDKPKPQQP